jgi:predicted Zn-dependent protease
MHTTQAQQHRHPQSSLLQVTCYQKNRGSFEGYTTTTTSSAARFYLHPQEEQRIKSAERTIRREGEEGE